MHLEERVSTLEQENVQLRSDLDRLLRYSMDRFVTPYELAELMHCSKYTIYRLIKEGKIFATRKLGDPKIPMSQFCEDPKELLQRKCVKKGINKIADSTEPTMQELIFG